ncbi:hypothetical protein SeMB42_g04939 [Synchytrium endobioticum]|uniref:Uncharacterized protein n=1 Tax=Synchytrium endobioticum TaxID=286115 RepID=A0A507CUT7_9FUNG|nr:hypothetical protein SeMB42_g04939 [Synchytrium endobioticum]
MELISPNPPNHRIRNIFCIHNNIIERKSRKIQQKNQKLQKSYHSSSYMYCSFYGSLVTTTESRMPRELQGGDKRSQPSRPYNVAPLIHMLKIIFPEDRTVFVFDGALTSAKSETSMKRHREWGKVVNG